MKPDIHYDHEVAKHDPKEGFDASEPHAPRITFFVIASVITLVVVIVALQNYFEGVWNAAVSEKVLTAAPPELKTQRNLENWRLTHYEYTSPAKTQVRLPLDRARELMLEEARQGKTFYPAKATVPVPEQPAAAPAAPKGDEKKGNEKK